jgi:hypothetical protein
MYYFQTAFLLSPILPRFNEFLPIDKFNKNIDIRTMNLSDAINLAKVWVSTNTIVEVGDLFIDFLKFYAIDFE